MANIYKSEAGRQAVEDQYRRILERWPVACEQRVVPTRQSITTAARFVRVRRVAR